MRLTELKFLDTELNKMFKALSSVLSNISSDNMVKLELEGETASVADTKKVFKHGMGSVPSLWLILEGNVYIQRNSVTENEIDIRSVNTDESFRIVLIK